MSRLRIARPEAIVASCRLPDGTALDLLDEAKRVGLEGPCCIVLADPNALDIAVEALRRGAEQFLVKPVDANEVLTLVRATLGA